MAIDDANNLIVCEEVRKIYKMGEVDVHALRGLNLEVKAGEFVAILGPSGCGKTTLLHLIGGLATPTSGKVIVDGQDMAHSHDGGRTRFRQKKIGFVFQRFNLLNFLTAEDNVKLALKIRGERSNGQLAKVQELLKVVGLEEKMKNRPLQMSQGEQQRVAIARALIGDPTILLADEPTGNLDSGNSDRILSLMRRLNEEMNQTILMITHDRHAAKYATRRVRMLDGIIVDQNAD
jgi:putative ABC transport system ATP-binding protein